ncbi:MAG: hypothetical protein ACFFA4_04495 [Promethearchaeota archaeon]
MDRLEIVMKELDVNIQGSGIGLILSREIVEIHHDNILVEPKEGYKVSNSIITLPIS